MERDSMTPRVSVRYKMWKQPLHKWDAWIANRHRTTKHCDAWSQFIVDSCVGKTAVYNSGGMFFTDFIPDITVIEQSVCPIASMDQMLFVNAGAEFQNEFDNLILVNPISLKYNHSIADFLVSPGISRAGQKPNLLEWLKCPGKIYLSTSDWHLYYDRLKYTVHEMVAQQIKELNQIGVRCEYLEITPVGLDFENGNIKMVLSVHNDSIKI